MNNGYRMVKVNFIVKADSDNEAKEKVLHAIEEDIKTDDIIMDRISSKAYPSWADYRFSSCEILNYGK